MIDQFLTPDQQLLRDNIARFARAELSHGAVARAQASHFDPAIVKKLAAVGLFGILIGEEDGGQGGNLIDAIIAIQEVALACPRSADLVQATNFGAIRTLAEYATAEQKQRWLPPLLDGSALISVAMSEPQAGSAVTDLATTATPDGVGFRLNGTKVFGTHSSDAAMFLVYCRFGPGVDGIGSVIIERGQDGLTIGRPTAFMNGETWSQLYFDNVHVKPENVLLEKGGFKKQIAGFNIERLGNAARSVAVGRHAFNLARDHALSRHQFGRPLAEFQGIQWKFAEMATRLDGANMLLMSAAHAYNGLPNAYDTAVAKLACNEAGYFAANESLQIMGGLGFSEESMVQYCFRRTRGWMIAGGTIEILKNRIAEAIFDRPFSQRPEGHGNG